MKKRLEESRVRLTFVVTAGGTANTFVLKFARFIAESGLAVTVIADGLSRGSQTIGEGSLSLIPVAMEREPHIIRDLQSLALLFSELRRIKPDILVYATPKASLLTAISGFLLRVPKRIYQVWGLRLETTIGIKYKILMIMELLTSILSTKILANSKSLASKYTSLGLNHSRPVNVLSEGSSHGVDLEYFSKFSIIPEIDPLASAFLADRADHLTVGFAGRLHPDKGIDTLMNAINLIKKAGVNVNFLLIGGDEGANFPAELESGIDFLKIDFVTDVRPYYAVIDVLVLPSLREGFPNVVLEAAAMEVPAIVSDGTGVVDSVIDGKTGFVVPVNDSVSLADAIIKFSENRELAPALGAVARKRAEDYFSQEDVWQGALDYFQR